MRTILYFIIITILSTLLIGCSKENSQTNFKRYDFNSEEIELNGVEMLQEYHSLFRLRVTSDYIILSTSNEPLIHVMDRNNLKELVSFGEFGRGPGEFSHIVDFTAIQDSEDLIIRYHDYNLLFFNEVELQENGDSLNFDFKDRIELPGVLMGVIDLYKLSNNQFVGVYDDIFDQRIDSKTGVFNYSVSSDKLKTYAVEFLNVSPFEKNTATNINISPSSYNQNKNIIAVSKLYSPIIEIVPLTEGNENKRLIYSDNKYTNNYKAEDFLDGNLRQFYLSLDTTEKYLYALFSGKNISESDQSTEVHVLTWDGTPVKKYLIPGEYDISYIEVDDSGKTLYGISFRKDKLFKFDLITE